MAKDMAQPVEGRCESAHGQIDETRAQMLGATLQCKAAADDLLAGAVLPPLWHWAAFPPIAPMDDLGIDGHPRLGNGLLPDLGLPRRMWAGGTLSFVKPLHIGEPLTRRSEIVSVEHKDGRAGPMALVQVEHRISGASGLAIEERQDIVYLQIPERYTPPARILAPEDPELSAYVAIDPVLLFRYSAVTFNGHRIHYDRSYAQEVEHYPGLVVHGPLQATLLIEAATRHRGRSPDRFRYRGVYPMFDSHDLRLFGVATGPDAMRLCTAAPEGHQGMQATAEWTI